MITALKILSCLSLISLFMTALAGNEYAERVASAVFSFAALLSAAIILFL